MYPNLPVPGDISSMRSQMSSASDAGQLPSANSASSVRSYSMQGDDNSASQQQDNDDQVQPAQAPQVPSQTPSSPPAAAAPSAQSSQDNGSQNSGDLQRPDAMSDYLQKLKRPSLRITVDSVNEGYKKKDKNAYEDQSIRIKNKNATDFIRNGQVQTFEGPGFNMRTAVLTENTGNKIKTHVITSQESEKNYTRGRDRLTQFVGTLDTAQFSSGAMLTDRANRIASGSVRQTADGNREARLRKQDNNNLTRGSFLKTPTLKINANYQSDSFSDRQKLISDILLGNGDSSPSNGSQDDNASRPASMPGYGGQQASPSGRAGDDQDEQ